MLSGLGCGPYEASVPEGRLKSRAPFTRPPLIARIRHIILISFPKYRVRRVLMNIKRLQ